MPLAARLDLRERGFTLLHLVVARPRSVVAVIATPR
jgi:hypothetical protein